MSEDEAIDYEALRVRFPWVGLGSTEDSDDHPPLIPATELTSRASDRIFSPISDRGITAGVSA